MFPFVIKRPVMKRYPQYPGLLSPPENNPEQKLSLYPKATYGSTSSLGAGDGSLETLSTSFANMDVKDMILSPLQEYRVVSLLGNMGEQARAPDQVHNPPPPIRLATEAACTKSKHSNCPSKFMRSTINVVPIDSNSQSKTGIPLGLYVAPYLEDDEIPIINTPNIVRCRRCRTYINPYVQFLDRGQRWKCNLCYFPNDLPANYDHDAETHIQIDRYQKPELNYAVVEYIAPTEYMLRPPQPPVFVFICDVSLNSVRSGILQQLCFTLLETLDLLPNQDGRTLVGLITVDKQIHYYKLKPMQEPQMIVVGDVDEVYLPMPQDLLVNLQENKDSLRILLQKLPKMHESNTEQLFSLGCALQAAHLLLSPTGGKIVLVSCSRPNSSLGSLTRREQGLDSSLFLPSNSFYKQFAVECSKVQVSVDMFLFPLDYLDLASIAPASRITAGLVFFYQDLDFAKFHVEFQEHLRQNIALEAVMRVRASKGIEMSMYYGNFFVRSTDLLSLANVNPKTTYVIEYKIKEQIQSSVVCFQTALLHTTSSGERRIRVLTLALPTSSNPTDLFFAVDCGAVMALLTRKALERGLESSFSNAREAIQNKVGEIVNFFKKLHHPTVSYLSLPENIQLLPIFCLSLTKHFSMRLSMEPLDQRSYFIEHLRVIPIDILLYHLHPMVLCLVSNTLIPLSSESLSREGVYLIYNGTVIYIWVSRQVPEKILLELFQQVTSGPFQLQEPHSKLSEQMNQTITALQEKTLKACLVYPSIFLVQEDSKYRQEALSQFIEDRANGLSYPAFLAGINKGN